MPLEAAYEYLPGADLYAVGMSFGPKFAIFHGAILSSLQNWVFPRVESGRKMPLEFSENLDPNSIEGPDSIIDFCLRTDRFIRNPKFGGFQSC